MKRGFVRVDPNFGWTRVLLAAQPRPFSFGMKPDDIHRPISRIVDREVFAQNLLRAIEPLPTPELRRFLEECTNDNRGTEAEALIIDLVEGQLALREIRDGELAD